MNEERETTVTEQQISAGFQHALARPGQQVTVLSGADKAALQAEAARLRRQADQMEAQAGA